MGLLWALGRRPLRFRACRLHLRPSLLPVPRPMRSRGRICWRHRFRSPRLPGRLRWSRSWSLMGLVAPACPAGRVFCSIERNRKWNSSMNLLHVLTLQCPMLEQCFVNLGLVGFRVVAAKHGAEGLHRRLYEMLPLRAHENPLVGMHFEERIIAGEVFIGRSGNAFGDLGDHDVGADHADFLTNRFSSTNGRPSGIMPSIPCWRMMLNR